MVPVARTALWHCLLDCLYDCLLDCLYDCLLAVTMGRVTEQKEADVSLSKRKPKNKCDTCDKQKDVTTEL